MSDTGNEAIDFFNDFVWDETCITKCLGKYFPVDENDPKESFREVYDGLLDLKYELKDERRNSFELKCVKFLIEVVELEMERLGILSEDNKKESLNISAKNMVLGNGGFISKMAVSTTIKPFKKSMTFLVPEDEGGTKECLKTIINILNDRKTTLKKKREKRMELMFIRFLVGVSSQTSF